MNFAQFFPTVVGIKQFNEDLQPMISKCYELYETIPNTGDKFIAKKRYTTHNAVNLNEVKEFENLNNFIFNSIEEYCDNLKLNTNNIDKNPKGAWFNIHKKYDYTEFHTHTNTFLTAVFYLKCSENSSKLWLNSPVKSEMELDKIEENNLNSNTVYFNPKPGMLLIFRSNIEHCVEQNLTDEDRISLSYNYGVINE